MVGTLSKRVLLLCLCVLFLGGAFLFRIELSNAFFRLGLSYPSFLFDPSAGRAYRIAMHHFDDATERSYNIETAERFFRYTEQLDRDYPRVNHQLARIAFLKGQNDIALARIDAELAICDNCAASHYIRGLILGFMGRPQEAAEEFKTFLLWDPVNWAALNDLLWVLFAAGEYEEVKKEGAEAVALFPYNPWILNTYGMALFYLGEEDTALEILERSLFYTRFVTEEKWLTAYPGNDPKIAPRGVSALRDAIRENIHTVLSKE